METHRWDAPYYRTSEKTKLNLKDWYSNGSSPTTVFYESIEKEGGITRLENDAGHARNVRQVKYVKRHLLNHQVTR